MKLLSRIVQVIAREVIARLFADALIRSHPLWACALELELAAVMRAYVAEDDRLDAEVDEMLRASGGHSPERFAQLKQELARERGFSLGDAGIARVVETMALRVECSPLADFVGVPVHALREEIHALMRKHLGSSLSLAMTPQLQQAIKLLQLSRMELLETVREEMETNPLLEQPDETADGNINEQAPGEASFEAATAESPEALGAKTPERADEVKGEGPAEIDWDTYFNSDLFNEPGTASHKGNVAAEDPPSFYANLAGKGAVKKHIQQIIAAEDGRSPHSDQEMVELLRAKGVDTTARTVARCREVLGVPSASKRKKPR